MTVLDDLIDKLEAQATTAMPVLAAWPNIQAELEALQGGLDHHDPDERRIIETKIERAIQLLEAYQNRLLSDMAGIKTQHQSSHRSEAACLAYNNRPKRPRT